MDIEELEDAIIEYVANNVEITDVYNEYDVVRAFTPEELLDEIALDDIITYLKNNLSSHVLASYFNNVNTNASISTEQPQSQQQAYYRSNSG